jgi:hypothetical protein
MFGMLVDKIEKAIEQDKKKPNLGLIDIEKVKELYQNGALMLDVRPVGKVEGKNVEEAGIKNAYYIPITEITKHLDKLPKDKEAPIITTCKLVKFANRAMGYLEALGYTNVYVFDGSTPDLIAALSNG